MAEAYIEVAYYSKSKCFLYPILKFRREETFKPDTFLFFHDHSIVNGDLTVYYRNNASILYQNFEAERIAPHPLLVGCYKLPEGTAYIFNIAGHLDDIEHFLRGEYSLFSKSLKQTVLRYFGDDIEPMQPRPDRFTHAVLFPEEYRKFVARNLGVSPKLLTELAPLYDQERETLYVENWNHCGITTPIKTTTPI